ncbi:hypothetical protein SAMN06295967_11590 [Belliella buryatensis]|uniref:TolB-like 6-blade propeller-like n=1 Tax=Belliella buryatensis TaxID=1500549 RepID=A0A239GBB6_9BACT|nr:hypothetical protein [Belliella buryatensis]SNS66626.1 hypothetical protein SAMN06295967_11590 [Belliella buryatensis]
MFMIQRCIFCFSLIGFLSCNVKDDDQVNFKEFELKIEESKISNDKIGFFQKPDKSQLVSDSLIVSVGGFSGISIYNLNNGEQIDFVNTLSDPKRSLIFSTFDASEFPDIYLLESKRKMIYVYNFEEKEFTQTFRLGLDESTSIPLFGGKFKKYRDNFYIELNAVETSLLDPEYYRKSGEFMGVFDTEGKQIKRVIRYPKQMTHPEGHFIPNNYYSFDIYEDRLYICFPFEKEIRVYDINEDFEKYESIPLPLKGYMTLDLIEIPEKFNPQLIPIEQRQISARVSNLIVESGKLYLFFAINDNKQNEFYRVFCSLYQLDLEEVKWNVQKNHIDLYEFGEFIGVSGEKLVYLDASLKNKDNKFINLAVMK